jgi:hypothetical protein
MKFIIKIYLQHINLLFDLFRWKGSDSSVPSDYELEQWVMEFVFWVGQRLPCFAQC